MEKTRYPEIDFLKFVCILTVVYIHSISTGFYPASFSGRLAGDATRFAVPGLFFAAGFLFEKRNYTTTNLAKRKLVRLLPPYLFCSLCLQFLNVPGLNVPMPTIDFYQLAHNLLFGDTFGIYYFVFVLFYLYAASLLLRRLPDHWAFASWAMSGLLLVLFLKGVIGGRMSLFLLFRCPYFHLFAYMSGWMFSLHYEEIKRFLRKYRKVVIGAGTALALATFAGTHANGVDRVSFSILTQVYIYAVLAIVIAVGISPGRFQAGIRLISGFSYGIYLIHFPIVRTVQGLRPELSSDYCFTYALVAWSVGVSASLLIILAARKVAGRYAVHLVGC